MPEWRRECLGNVAEIRPSNVDKKSSFGEQPVRLCNYMDVYTRDYITEDIPFMEATATAGELQRFRVERGDVLMTKDSETPDDIGISAVVLDNIADLVCGYHLALLKPDRARVDPTYLAKQLASVESARYFGRLANGSTRYGLTQGALAATPIWLAPLGQQRRIAEVLVTVDEAIRQTEALIAKTQQIQAGLMHDLFNRGVLPDGRIRPPREDAPELYQESPLGWIPKEWDVVSVDALCGQVVDCPHSTPVYVERGVPCIRTADMLPGELLIETALRVSESTYQERIARLVPQRGDVIYSREGERLGIASPIDEVPVCLGQRVMLLRPSSATNAAFLLWVMNTPTFYRRVVSGLGATTSPHINVGDIRRQKVCRPSRAEQDRIGHALTTVQSSLRAEATEQRKLLALKQGLMRDLLTARVRASVSDGQGS